jgi:tetratricopeptide (TPR) repeat protein
MTPGEKGMAKAPAMPEGFRNKCDAAKGQLRPLVVEWTAPDRAALESQARQGLLVVKYSGCDLEVLRRCKAPDRFAYQYTAITPKDENVRMANANELYASIPVYAAKFEGKLAEKGELNAAMTIVGEYGARGEPPALDQLEGECGGATHVVAALTVGAFSFSAGAAKSAGASAEVLGAGAGAERSSEHETLSRDGDVHACASSKRGDAAPPENCGALLRLELVLVLPAGEGIPECGPGTRLVGKECKPVEKPSELAPDDQSFVDDKNGYGWSVRCYNHYRAGALPYARAACQKALEANPNAETRGMALYNYALVENASGDPVGACKLLSQALNARDSATARKKTEELACKELMTGHKH